MDLQPNAPPARSAAAGAALLERTFALLERATADRRSNLRTFALATVEDGRPAARMVVLRNVDRVKRSIDFWTDGRSDKVPALARPVEALFWDPKTSIQLRLLARAEVAGTNDADVAALFDGLPDRALGDYATATAPGTDWTGDGTFDRERARANFTRVRLFASEADLLELGETHRRFQVRFDGSETVAPVTP